jgi:anti-anti-sigma regulatory factor
VNGDDPEALRRRIAHLEAQLALAEGHKGYLAALHQTALGLVGRLDVDDLLEAILKNAADLLATPHGSLHMLSDDGTHMVTRIATGALAEHLGMPSYPGEGVIGRVWKSGECLIVRDYDTWSGNPGRIRKGALHTLIGVPFSRDDKVIGVFVLGLSDAGATFPEVAEQLMTAFGQLASIAIDNAFKVELIEKQMRIIRELGAPILHVWDRVVTMPLIGVVDSQRAGEVMDSLLTEVSKTGSLFAILDLTGVDVVDTATAGHLLAMARAVKLLGAEGIITGIRPQIAQTMVAQGLDISSVVTLASLREGLQHCMRRLAQ